MKRTPKDTVRAISAQMPKIAAHEARVRAATFARERAAAGDESLREQLAGLVARWKRDALNPYSDPGSAATLEGCADDLSEILTGKG